MRARLASTALSLALAACAGPSTDAPPAREAARAHGDERERDDEAARAAQEARSRALAAAEPSAVAPADRSDYFDAVTERYGRVDPRPAPDAAPDEPEPEAMRKVLLLEQLVGGSDAKLAARIREWLVSRASDAFVQAYTNEASRVLASPPDSPWHRAEAAWVAWVTSHLSTFTERELYAIGVGMSADYITPAVKWFPGLDRFAFGLAVADLWARQGHPDLHDNDHPAFEVVVCSVDDSYGKLSSYCHNGYASGWWYQPAMASDADTQRLEQAVLARKDPMLTVSVALGVGRSPKTLDVLHAWEKDAAIWRDALLVIAREDDWHWMRDWLYPEMKRVWTAHPDWRGTILYALALTAGQYADNGPEFEINEGFDRFVRDFAHGVTRADFESFLDQAPRAIEFARWLMPDRTKGWSVADVIVPRLDAYLALPQDVPADPAQGPGFGSLVSYLCRDDHDLRGIAALRAYFAKRAPAHPGDPLNVMMDPYTPGECRAH